MRKMSVEMLQKYPYPNFMAEIMESNYSLCTIGKWMGIGNYCEEDDPEVWARLNGEKKISINEAESLTKLFGVKMEYLFSHELRMCEGKSIAYWRWLDWNKQRERELSEYKIRTEIDRKLKENPFLLEVVLKIVNMSEKELNQLKGKLEKASDAA